MTKLELIKLLEDYPDDTVILVVNDGDSYEANALSPRYKVQCSGYIDWELTDDCFGSTNPHRKIPEGVVLS